MKVLLVTGSRTLREGKAPGWAWKLLEPAVAAADLIIAGDAPGPDTWAMELASPMLNTPRERRIFGLDGFVYRGERGFLARTWRTWCADPVRGRKLAGSRWPLVRNEEMVRHVAALGGEGHEVRVLALVAPWARTHGTYHTLGLCGNWPRDVRTCPPELGPQEAQ